MSALNDAGIAMGRRRIVQRYIDDGSLILPFGEFVSIGTLGYFIVHARLDSISRCLATFISWLKSSVNKAV